MSSLSHSDTVVSAAFDAGDFAFSLQRLDDCRMQNDCFIVTSALLDTSLAVAVQAPCIDLAVLVDSKRVVRPSANVNAALWQSELSRRKSIMFGALNRAPTELMLLTRTPCIDRTVACKCENVIRAACKSCNLFQSFYQHRPVFDSDDLSFLPSEANHSFVSLREEVNNLPKGS